MENWKIIIVFKSISISAGVASFVGVILSYVVFPVDLWWVGLVTFLSLFALLALSIFFFLRFHNHHNIYGKGSFDIDAIYGDILEIKVKNNQKNKPVIVIPVNSSFDSIVEDDLTIPDRIVDGESIHGQWLKKYACDKLSLKMLQEDISKGIKDRKIPLDHTLLNKRGNKEIYELGSYIFVERDDYSFLLFALTEFDEQNKVIKNDSEGFVQLMKKLLDATDHCANRHVYIPIMGTKIGLFGINHKESFEYIKNAALNKKDFLRADISIVIYNGDRDKVSIYD